LKFLITGATGFLGSRIAEMLVEKNHEVIALVRNPDKAAKLKKSGITIAIGDIKGQGKHEGTDERYRRRFSCCRLV